ncbi:MAG: hypothetical protein A2Z96_06000 [Spirochaetes bacterium GWB1_48_6]|nr:MAG: hypothetical protein A2Z96_06000 [Spirochaetes bacterium GWB1_48_6]
MKLYHLIPLLLLTGCQTVDVTFEEGINPEIYFHRAQTAVDGKNYEIALVIYQKFLDTNPTDLAFRVSAEYEIGFLNYKLGKNAVALEWLKKVSDRYDDPSQISFLPPWPKNLAQKLVNKIQPEVSPAPQL